MTAKYDKQMRIIFGRNAAAGILSTTGFAIVAILLAAATFVVGTPELQRAYAASVTWDGGGDGVNFSDPLNWDADAVPTGSDTILIGAAGASSVEVDVNFTINADGSIVISGDNELIIPTRRTLSNFGTITIAHSSADNNGIANGGTINNSGIITVANGGSSIGISNFGGGTISNSGTIKVENGSSFGISNTGTSTINNSGTIIVVNGSGKGISNDETINNSGTITVANSGSSIGIFNEGRSAATIINSGTINVENSGTSTGIENFQSGTITIEHSGVLKVENSGSESTGISNDNSKINDLGTVTVANSSDHSTGILSTNGGTIAVEAQGMMTIGNNDDSYGINNKIGSAINNSGNIMVENSDNESHGIVNDASTISNSGTLTLKNGGGSFSGITNDHGTISNSGTLMVESSSDVSIIGINNFGGTISNSGTLTLKNGGSGSEGISNSNTGTINNSGTLIIANTGGRGIDNSGAVIDNLKTITVENTGAISSGINNEIDGIIVNAGAITINSGARIENKASIMIKDLGVINNYGSFNNQASGSVDNDGHIAIYSGGEIDNAGSIDNTFGSIINKCGGAFNGNAPIGNAVVNESCDASPPSITVTSPIAGAALSSAFTVSGTASDSDSGLQKVEVSTDGGSSYSTTLATISGNTWSFAASGQTEGTHSIVAKATDNAGNTAISIPPVTVTVDTIAPTTISITSPTSGAFLKGSFTVSGTAADNSGGAGLAKVEVSIDNGATYQLASGTTSWTYAVTGLADNDSLSIIAKATDKAGNIKTSSIVTVHVDATRPDTRITTAQDGSGKVVANGGKTSSNSVKFTFAGSDNVAVKGFECSLDGAPYLTCTSSQSYAALSSKAHTFQVRAIDLSGNMDDLTPAKFTWSVTSNKIK